MWLVHSRKVVYIMDKKLQKIIFKHSSEKALIEVIVFGILTLISFGFTLFFALHPHEKISAQFQYQGLAAALTLAFTICLLIATVLKFYDYRETLSSVSELVLIYDLMIKTGVEATFEKAKEKEAVLKQKIADQEAIIQNTEQLLDRHRATKNALQQQYEILNYPKQFAFYEDILQYCESQTS